MYPVASAADTRPLSSSRFTHNVQWLALHDKLAALQHQRQSWEVRRLCNCERYQNASSSNRTSVESPSPTSLGVSPGTKVTISISKRGKRPSNAKSLQSHKMDGCRAAFYLLFTARMYATAIDVHLRALEKFTRKSALPEYATSKLRS